MILSLSENVKVLQSTSYLKQESDENFSQTSCTAYAQAVKATARDGEASIIISKLHDYTKINLVVFGANECDKGRS